MPKNDSITINLVDLDNVVQLIVEKQPAGGSVQITMVGNSISVRDKDGMLIGSLQQTITE